MTDLSQITDRRVDEAAPYDGRLELLRRMYEIRLFEDTVQAWFGKGFMRGSTHLCQGQEAVSVGVAAVLNPGDTMTCTYRGHGAVLAMGAPLEASFAEVLGRETGLCRGKGGSMHLTDLSVGALGSFAIVGAHLPISAGAAWAAQLTGSGAVSVSICGDGATNIGCFHETLNLAAIWRLPVVFVIENNLYGEYSPIESTTPVTELYRRADAYAMPGVRVDGNDVIAVRDTMRQAVQRARDGGGPTLVEAMTYRQSGHSRSDPGSYRPPGELEAWLERDPLRITERQLSERGAPEDDLARVRAAAEQAVGRAAETALASPDPDPETRFDDVWAAT